MGDKFRKFSQTVAGWVGTPLCFAAACLTILLWACLGPSFGYSDTWQLVINTGTTIVTFLMVFLIQNTQNRDAQAIHLKLNELIRANSKARNDLIDLESLSNEQLQILHEEFCKMQKQTEHRLQEIDHHRHKREKQKD